MAKENVKEGVSSIEKLVGFILALMRISRHKSVPLEAICRLGTEDGYATVVEIVDLAHADWLAEQPNSVERPSQQSSHPHRDAPTANGDTLPKDHYRVYVSYAPMPSMDELKQEFGENNVSAIFDGREFTYHASCVGADQTPGERIMRVKHFGRNTESVANIAEMDNLGYRPGTHIEAYAFAKAHPDLQRQYWIVALGSFALVGDDRCVAVLRGDSGGRIFGLRWFGGRWSSDCRFLFVRK